MNFSKLINNKYLRIFGFIALISFAISEHKPKDKNLSDNVKAEFDKIKSNINDVRNKIESAQYQKPVDQNESKKKSYSNPYEYLYHKNEYQELQNSPEYKNLLKQYSKNLENNAKNLENIKQGKILKLVTNFPLGDSRVKNILSKIDNNVIKSQEDFDKIINGLLNDDQKKIYNESKEKINYIDMPIYPNFYQQKNVEFVNVLCGDKVSFLLMILADNKAVEKNAIKEYVYGSNQNIIIEKMLKYAFVNSFKIAQVPQVVIKNDKELYKDLFSLSSKIKNYTDSKSLMIYIKILSRQPTNSNINCQTLTENNVTN